MEYYSFISHGVLLDNKKIDPIDRKLNEMYTPIIMFGTQSMATQNSFTLSYYILFTKKYGVSFLNELASALKEHPREYIRLYQVRDSNNAYQVAVRYLFDINSVEIQKFPQNKFRVFLSGDPVRQPLDVFLTSSHEMVVGKMKVNDDYSKTLVDRQVNRLDPMFSYFKDDKVGSIPMFHTIKKSKSQYGKTENVIGLVYPFGLYKTSHLSTFEFQKFYTSRLSELTRELSQITTTKNQRKQAFRHPTFHHIGAFFVFSCKSPLSKTIRNFQYPEEQYGNQGKVVTPPSVLASIKLVFDPETNKFHVRSVPTLGALVYDTETKSMQHLRMIQNKRKQRMEKKKQTMEDQK